MPPQYYGLLLKGESLSAVGGIQNKQTVQQSDGLLKLGKNKEIQ
jgi:hypothetical protein